MVLVGCAVLALFTARAAPCAPVPSGRPADTGVAPSAGVRAEARPLTTALSVRSLTAVDASERRPVHLRAQVVYYDPARRHCFVMDDSSGIFVSLSSWPAVRTGDLVEIAGTSDPGHYAPRVVGTILRVLGHRPLAAPRRVSLERLLSGHEDGQWIEVAGIIRAVYPPVHYPNGGDRLFIDMVSGGMRMPLHLPYEWRGPVPSQLVDARVRLSAVIGTSFSPTRQLMGIVLYVPSFDLIVTERPAPDPATLPIQPIGQLFRYTTVGGFEHRIRTAGVVTAVMPEQFYLGDGTAGVAAVPAGPVPKIRIGDRVIVTGFPESGNEAPVLRDVEVLSAQEGPPPKPIPTTPAAILEGGMDSRLVSLEATLVRSVVSADRETLLLEAGGSLFTAEIAGTSHRHFAIPGGSRVRLIGLCDVITDDRDALRVPRSFKLRLRSTEDVRLVSLPPWWSLQRTLWVVSGLVGVILLALAWVAILRRRVRDQTAVIRERLEQEIALQARYRELFDNANDVICTWNVDGLLTSMNRAAERVTGYSRDEAMQMPFTNLVAHEHRGRVEDMIGETVQSGQGTTFEADLVTRDGQRITLEFDAHRLTHAGAVVGIQAIGRDVTERKLTESALRRAKEAAESASRAKTEFVTNMSHELRTPLNGILGMTGLLQHSDLDAEQSHCLAMMRTSAESLTHIVNDVLDYAKIEAGRLTLNTQAFDLRECVADMLQALAGTARESGLALVGRVAPDVPRTIVADPDRLRQVLTNLVGNGLKFTSQGEVRLDVEALCCGPDESEADAEWLMTFRITDTGIGIPSDKHRMIFDAFTQADGSMTRRYGGTGLGLAISSAVVQLMGGTIGVESEEGRGSTFSLTVPVKARPTAHPVPGLPAATVLVLDQHQASRDEAAERLAGWGLSPAPAGSLRDAVAFLASPAGRECRIVLADVQSVQGPLAQLVDALRQHTPSAKLVACGLSPQPEEAEAVRRCGVVAFLPKPLRDSELLTACQAALRHRPSGDRADAAGRAAGAAVRTAVVLLVEDNVINQRVAGQILKRRGHEVRIAHNGRQAVEVLDRWTPDVVFMDVQMPEMNGIDATRAIRAREQVRGGHVPIIALTAHAMAADREMCLQAGMDDYLTKPVSPSALTQTVERIVADRTSDSKANGPANGNADAVLDPAGALERVDGDRELLGEIIGLFQQDVDALVEELEAAVRSKDPEAIMRTAHRLKGSVATFAAKPATAAALHLETMGREGNIADADAAFADLKAELARLQPVLESLRLEVQG